MFINLDLNKKQKTKTKTRKPCNETEVIRQFCRIFLTFKILYTKVFFWFFMQDIVDFNDLLGSVVTVVRQHWRAALLRCF